MKEIGLLVLALIGLCVVLPITVVVVGMVIASPTPFVGLLLMGLVLAGAMSK